MGHYLHPLQFISGLRFNCDVTGVTGVTALFHAGFGVTGAAVTGVTDVTARAVYGLRKMPSPEPGSIWGAWARTSLRLSSRDASRLPNG